MFEPGVGLPVEGCKTSEMLMRNAAMVCEEVDERVIADELTRWFIRRLDEMKIRLEDEVLSYDCNTAYDYVFFRLQADAQEYCEKTYGYLPSPGQLTTAFFGAEYERARRDRLAQRSWVAKFSDFIGRKNRPL
ncbi:MAG: hypothetical protein MUF20_06665 [Methylotetracoccus sp.]|jgi:hypothetical protein|nr:hypothetical protein [Methylotetracoccus sp.]